MLFRFSLASGPVQISIIHGRMVYSVAMVKLSLSLLLAQSYS
jgi:hypothetical protein